MQRSIGAFLAGLIAWLLVVSLLDRLLRVTLDGYAAAEPAMTFTLNMMLARLGMAAVTSLAAGAITARIAGASSRVPWLLGVLILAAFIPVHVRLWHTFPIWYHLSFLVPIVPLVVIGSRLLPTRSRSGSEAPQGSPPGGP